MTLITDLDDYDGLPHTGGRWAGRGPVRSRTTLAALELLHALRPGEPLTPADVAAALRITRARARSILHRLVCADLAVRSARAQYHPSHPRPSAPPAPPPAPGLTPRVRAALARAEQVVAQREAEQRAAAGEGDQDDRITR